MAVHERGHDRGPARIDDNRSRARLRRDVIAVIDACKHAVVDEHADGQAQPRRHAVGQGSAGIQNAFGHRVACYVSMRDGSSSAAELAMKSRRGPTSLPISRSKMAFADAASSTLIRRSTRWRGSIVVSAS